MVKLRKRIPKASGATIPLAGRTTILERRPKGFRSCRASLHPPRGARRKLGIPPGQIASSKTNSTMSQIVVASNTVGEVAIATRTLKSGSVVTTFLNKRAFAEANPAVKEQGSAALNRAHYEYKRQFMQNQNTVLGAAIASGDYLAKSVRRAPDGSLHPVLIPRTSLKAPVAKEKTMSVDDLRAAAAALGLSLVESRVHELATA